MRTASRSSILGFDPPGNGRFEPRSATFLRGQPQWSTHAPNPAIADHVSAYWAVELRGASHLLRTLPDASVDLTVDLRRPRVYVTGPQKKPRTRRLHGHVHLLGARLQPGSATLLGIDLARVNDDWTPLEVFVPPAQVRRLTAAIDRARDLAARIAALDAFLVDRLLNRRIDRRLSRALALLFQHQGALSMAALASETRVDPRTLSRLFQRSVGLPPKRFSRVVRFQWAIRNLDRGDSWAALAADLGYFDQAHLIRDLKELFGATPTQARALAARTR